VTQLEVLDRKNRWKLHRTILSGFLKKYFADKGSTVDILEAGCGETWNLDLEGIDYVLTGLDSSKEALEVRKHKQHDLDKAIVADLRTVELSDDEYDVIYCSYVLEHVKGAEEVLHKFFRWLKPKGVLVLLIPDRDTVVGFISRLAPFWSHVFFYKYIRKDRNAGKLGHCPFRTYYDKIISRRGIHAYCQSHGHRILVEYADYFDSIGVFGVFSRLFAAFFKLVEIASLKRLSCSHSGLIYVIEK
jgi:ubiquinone/menaquinone biosynthesis C-methylase UbiE